MKSRQFLPSQRLTNARASIPAEILALGPSCVSPIAAAQTRIVSVARIRLDSWKSERLFKGIICDDVSEFESHMASHAVWSPSAEMWAALKTALRPQLAARCII